MNIKPYLYYVIFALVALLVLFISIADDSSTYKHVLRISDGKIISFDKMIDEVSAVDIVFIGEQHDNEKHHNAQLEFIRGIHKTGILLSIGLEMFMAKDQNQLDRWVGGNLELKSFLKTYYDFWRLPWPLYRNIFVFSRENRIPMVGLNVPKEITRKISIHGFQSLTPEDSKKLPPGITCDDIDEKYMDFIRKAYRVHDRKGIDFVHFCEAQMVWDKAMAWHLFSYMKEKPEKTVIVLSGIGHSWKRGIPEQVKKQTTYSFKVILPEVPDRVNGENITLEDADYLLLG